MNWSHTNSLHSYNIPQWSEGYVDIDKNGDVIVRPNPNKHTTINLAGLVEELQHIDFKLPVLVRFRDILQDRVRLLTHSFYTAINQNQYQGAFTAAYPIKVNQQRRVIEEIVQTETEHPHAIGLEAGSKPELMAVLSLCQHPNTMIICNGYKDRSYIRLALICQHMGHQVFIVIEKLSELDLILDEAKKLNIEPNLGVRVRLASAGSSNWQNTGGEKGKFGLSASQLLLLINKLKEHNCCHILTLLHCHLGSQIASLDDIHFGIQECSQHLVQLNQHNININYMDVGGGLGIDYEGTQSQSFCSINYSIEEYANTIITTLKQICDINNISHPHVITESGRAMTAHHAVLLTNIVDSENPKPLHSQYMLLEKLSPNLIALGTALKKLQQPANITDKNLILLFQQASQEIDAINTLFSQGNLSLQEKSQAEQIYQHICLVIRGQLEESQNNAELMQRLNEKLAIKLFVNFSIFQSIPDVWALNQIFPILPISNLHKKPKDHAVIADITCDSDGRIDNYVDNYGVNTTLSIPSYDSNKPFIIGIFLVGAYQEILGDMHNLFGDTHSIDIDITADGNYQLSNPIKGDSTASVLKYVNFTPERLTENYKKQMEKANLNPSQKQQFLTELKTSLDDYTYLNW